MYQSNPSVTIPPGQIFKNCQIPAPRGKFFWSNPRGWVFLGPLILLNFTLFTTLKTSIIDLHTEYLKTRRENIDLSTKICKNRKLLKVQFALAIKVLGTTKIFRSLRLSVYINVGFLINFPE